jgi:alkylation response protein AidB-like acyl-CoA dehydrogenase
VDFNLSPEQQLLRDTVRACLHDKYRFQDRLTILRSAEGFSRENWRTYAELGWLGAALPNEVGGAGGSVLDLALIFEEFGRKLVLEPLLPCIVLAAHLVDVAADAEQRARLLPPLVSGHSLAALAHVEPGARGSVSFVTMRAERRRHGTYVLNGRKVLVLGGASADWLIVSARTSGDASDRDGISLFEVPADSRGLLRHPYRTVDGHQAAELVFGDVEVDRTALIGHEGQASPALEDIFDLAIVAVCAEAVGAMDSVVTITRDYLKTRRAYGTTLSTFQALQHRLADMLVELELSRSMLYRALAAMSLPDRTARRTAIAAAKALVGRSGRFVGGCGIQLHGGMGMSDDYVVGHLFKRLTVIEALFGSSDFHLARVATASSSGDTASASPAADGARAVTTLSATLAETT